MKRVREFWLRPVYLKRYQCITALTWKVISTAMAERIGLRFGGLLLGIKLPVFSSCYENAWVSVSVILTAQKKAIKHHFSRHSLACAQTGPSFCRYRKYCISYNTNCRRVYSLLLIILDTVSIPVSWNSRKIAASYLCHCSRSTPQFDFYLQKL